MLRQRFAQRLFSGLIIFSLLLSSAPLAQAQDGPVYLPLVNNGQGRPAMPASDLLFRVQVRVATPSQAAKLAQPGIVVLAQGDDTATLLVDAAQLEYLAKAGFQPRGADALEALVQEQGPDWLSPSLQPLLQEAAAARQRLDLTAGRAADQVEALAGVRAALAVLAGEQRAALKELTELDDDGDGLTNTEESWWCTDPLNPNSDGDAQGYSDGQEVQTLLDVTHPRNVRWGYGPPFGPPNAWPNFNNRDGSGVKVCNDGDFDTIPDYAEVFMVGTRVPYESTDNDKFDDGQELFGVTYCPGAPTNCGYGSYPAVEYWNFIKAPMPNWVLPPGDSPFVAAFPVPEVTVEANSWTVERVTTITTSQGEMVEKTNSYETAVTRGQSTSIANTVTWNEWEEVSQAVETPLRSSAATGQRNSAAARQTNGSWWKTITGSALTIGGQIGLVGAGTAVGISAGSVGVGAALVGCVASVVCGAALVGGAIAVGVGGVLLSQGLEPDTPKNNLQITNHTNNYDQRDLSSNFYDYSSNSSQTNFILNNNNFDAQGIATSLDGIQYAINQQGQLLANGLQDISYQISRPRLTETRTNGKSWGGAQTTTHEVYEEHTISQGEAFTTGQNWSTAWAVDSSHAADLTFRYSVRNAGTEYARELSNLVFNIYIGDDTLPTISYPAWEQFAGGKLDNLFPVGPNTPAGVVSSKTFASTTIPLSLEQMKRIDLGERLTVKVESFSYGADELFYVDAIAGGVTVYIEDGVEDGDETVDQYVIPTWGAESVQDVLTRYFPHAEDADGNLNSLWTPEFSGIDAPTWHEHYLSDIAWWNVYLTQADGGDTPLHQLPARAGSGILFRFNRDSDRDGYNDRAEYRYYCALSANHADRSHCADGYLHPEIHPQPEVLAGYVVERDGNVATVKLALENTGTFDAYGIDAVMYSPDATTTIGNNTVGGNGKVRPGNKVTVGSMVKAPDLSNWGASRARPYAAGEYSGAVDRTFTFTAQTPGVVGTGSTAVAWNDGAGASGVLQLGGSYRAPLPVDVAHGVQVGFNTGTIDAGARFTVQALTSRDTFTYTINSEPFTPPVIVVSYSDPQGSHRFVTPVQLPALVDSLAPHVDAMLEGIELKIVATAPFVVNGANTTNLVVYSPHPATIRDGHLHLNFVSDGRLVLEKSYTLDIPAGPTTFAANWSVSEFSADYNPNGDNLLIAFWTDSENNIIDSAARPLNSFAADPKPAAASDAAAWNFGTVTQGEVLQRTVSLASVGDLDLLGYVHGAPGLSVSQTGSKPLGIGDVATYQLTLDTRTLPTGAYSGTVTLRTSDPAHPNYTVQVSGVIAPVSGDAYARGMLDRPLDVEVWVPGSHNAGDQILYSHNLTPQPQSLHPCQVFGSDIQQMLGYGRYCSPLSNGWIQPGLQDLNVDGTSITLHGVQRYRNIVVRNGGRIYVTPYNGDGATGRLTLYADSIYIDASSAVVADGRGYRGGSGNGEGPGGGARGSRDGGGGGGYGGAGGCGVQDNSSACDGSGGSPYGDTTSKSIEMGSAGGAGTDCGISGSGGGSIWLEANRVEIHGILSANGANANNQCSDGSAGGSGGGILVAGFSLLVDGTLVANGGNGGPTDDGGGGGGGGRIKILHTFGYVSGSQSARGGIGDGNGRNNNGQDGTTYISYVVPPFVAEQIEQPDYSSATVYAPRSFNNGTLYRIQYGRKLDFTTSGDLLTTLRVPAGLWTAASLDALISGVGSGDVTFKLDVGADGVWDWEQTRSVTNAATFSSPALAAAFAPYVNGAGRVDVPVKVYLSKPGQVLLTNMAVTRNQSVELAPAFVLSGSPTEGAVVPLNATVANSGAADSGPLTVSYYATRPSPLAPQYIGSVFLPSIPPGGSAAAQFAWNTLGFTGPVTVTASVDPYNRIAETNETNNQATASLTILTRPDLTAPSITFNDPEPLAGQPVTVTVTLRNSGQTPGNSQVVTLYNGNPAQGGAALGSRTVSIPANATRTAAFSWTPPAAGPYRLLARVDRTGVVNESDEGNNDTWFELPVGLASPVLLDSGAPGEAAYIPARGYGFIDEGQPDAAAACDSTTQRRDPDGKLVYRFDHLQPGRYYHLDLHMSECDGAGRRQTVYVDGYPVSDMRDLGDSQLDRLSILLDPALYADRSIRVTIEAEGIDGAVVDQVNLHNIDYRYADAGGSRDPQCTDASSFGWVDGVPNLTWGSLPYKSVRVDQSDNTLRYCFKAMDPAKRYNVHFSFWQPSGSARSQSILIDGVDAGIAGNVTAGVRSDVTAPVPLSAYQSDRRIDVNIVRTNAASGAMVNLLVLEEETLAASPATPAGSAVLELRPGAAATGLGQSVSLDVWVRTTEAVDGAAAFLDFDPNYLQVAGLTPGNSLPTVLQRSFDNTLGRIDFSAGALTGAALSSDFLLATVVFTGVNITPGTPVSLAAVQPRRSDVTHSGKSVFHHSEGSVVTVTEAVATLAGHMTPPGRPAAPHPRWRVPLRVTLSTTPGGPAVDTFTPTSDDNGNFIVAGLSPGVYRVGVKMANSLRSTLVVTFTNTQSSVDFGALRGGDANDDNYVTVLDFSILRTTFGKCQAEPGYDSRPDFNGDGCVTIVDFSIMRQNFGKGGDELRSGGSPSLLAEPTAVLQAEPAAPAIAVGQRVAVPLWVDAGGLEVDGAAAYLAFDPTVVQVVAVSAGEALPDLLQNEVDNQAGAVRFAAGSLEQVATGEFVLAVLELQAVGPGDAALYLVQTEPLHSDVTAAGVSVLSTVQAGALLVTPVDNNAATPQIFLPLIDSD